MTIWHPSEDDLILHFYGEGHDGSEPRVDEHLRTCVSCRMAWTDLTETLKLVDAARLPEAPSGFEGVMWARVEQALMVLRPMAPTRRSIWSIRQLVPLTALAALIVAAVALAVMSQRPATTVPATGAPASAVAARPDYTPERMLLTALDSHFEQTELLLVELMNAPDGANSDLDFERATADDLVASGRLYRATAERTGHTRVVQMLEDLEPVLVEVARSPAKVDKNEFKVWRERIGDADLLFKVRVVGNDIRERKQDLNAVIMNEGDL
ncbi:MAG TPA: hypothetical protein VES67_18050 [Vicinamibacterales bacterium]|nr:hypothetical protein [Vicinamibacterales bacterium]